MEETFHKWGIGKILTQKYWKRIIVARWRTNFQGYPIYLKTYSSDTYSILNYVSFPPRTSLTPRLTVRKSIKSLVLSPTLLQIYYIRLIGLITQFFWVWTAICDPTGVFTSELVKIKLKKMRFFLNKFYSNYIEANINARS